MSPSDRQSRLWLAGGGLKRAIRFATYDWTRELPFSLRVITMIGMGIQGYAIWAALSGSLIWPIMWPSGVILYATILLIYYIGFCIQNATLAAELIRKTQLESEQFAAQMIQKTLQPTTIAEIPGYEVDAFYKPLRAVGGDYFDVVDLPGNRTLFVVADVSGKGMPAALLAANIQALVRSLATMAPDVAALASQINRHLFRVHARQPIRDRGLHRAGQGFGRTAVRQRWPQSADRMACGADEFSRGHRNGPGLVRRHDL